MNPDLPASPALSLQQKLDRIAHERDVLSLQRELAQAGLREGDRVRAADGSTCGRVMIARDQSPPRLTVACEDGTQGDYSVARWLRA
jgi:hypothetical protein